MKKHLFFIVFVLFLFAACRSTTPPNVAKSSEALPDMELIDFTVEQTYKSGVDWKLYAKRAEIFEKKDVMYIYDLKITFLKNKELGRRKNVFLKAQNGVMFMETKNIRLYNDVYLKTEDGLELWTLELNWDNKRQQLHTNSSVKLRSGDNIILAQGMTSSPDLEDIVFKKVKGRLSYTAPKKE